jgi:S-adenosylmethionine synthetase
MTTVISDRVYSRDFINLKQIFSDKSESVHRVEISRTTFNRGMDVWPSIWTNMFVMPLEPYVSTSPYSKEFCLTDGNDTKIDRLRSSEQIRL